MKIVASQLRLPPQPQPQVYCHECACQQRSYRRQVKQQLGKRHIECSSIAPESLQDIIVGGAVAGAVGVALYSGLKKDPVPCSLCQGTGGIRCFGCAGQGTSSTVSRDDLYELGPPNRDILRRSIDPHRRNGSRRRDPDCG